MSKLNLSEAAADILNKSFSDAKAKEEKFGVGYQPKVSTPQQQVVDAGTAGHKTTNNNYDATKGVPTATPPGATPPVGSEKWGDSPSKGSDASAYKAQPAEKGALIQPEDGEMSAKDIADRKKGPKVKQTFSANKGAIVPESSEGDDEWEDEDEEGEEELEEASHEEVEADLKSLSDKEFMSKYNMSKKDAKAHLSDEDHDEEEDEDEEGCKVSDKMKEKMKEDVDAMLSGENLSEEFKQKAAMIFEAAVEARVEEIAGELEEKYTQEFEETLEVVKEDFASKLDSYLDYVVENWMEENKLAIEKGLRSEIVEDFIGALKNVFVEHYIDIPEDKVDIVEQLVEKVDELEDQVNEQILKNIDLKKSLAEQQKIEVIHSVCEGLSLSQVEKIKSLAKNVEFVSEEDFAEKLVSIRESYFPSGVKQATAESLNDTIELDEDNTTKVVDPLIEQYVNKISKLTKF